MSEFGFILCKLQSRYTSNRKILFHKSIYDKSYRLNYADNISINNLSSEVVNLIYYIYFNYALKKNTNYYRYKYKIDIKETNLKILQHSNINLFGFSFCNVNKRTSLNTFIWLNLSG